MRNFGLNLFTGVKVVAFFQYPRILSTPRTSCTLKNMDYHTILSGDKKKTRNIKKKRLKSKSHISSHTCYSLETFREQQLSESIC